MAVYFTFDKTVKLIITLAIIAGVIWLIDVLKLVLLPFCLACLLSYIIEPWVEYNRDSLRIKNRTSNVFITLGDGLILLFLFIYFLVPVVMHELNHMEIMMKQYGHNIFSLSFIPEPIRDYLQGKIDFQSLFQQFEEGKFGTWLNKGETVLSGSLEFVLHSLQWLVTFIYMIFILLDYQKLSSRFYLLIPKKYRPAVTQIMNDVKYYMNQYFRSQLFIACCAAVLYSVGFSIVGLPMAIVMCLLVGILYMVPYFQYITVIPVIIICFITSLDGHFDLWVKLGECGAVYIVSQCICDYILTPKIMGKSLGLNPAIILLSLSIWGTLLGIIGMIIALPLTTLLLVYYKKIIIDHTPLSSPTDVSMLNIDSEQ